MKKLFCLFITFFLLFPSAANAQGAGSAPAAAQAPDMKIVPPVPPTEQSANLFGQSHYYSVTLRGNGEAVISFKAILSNSGPTPLTTVTLQLPENVTPTDMLAYQVIQEPWCIRYDPRPLPVTQSTTRDMTTDSMYKAECAEYQQPNYQYVSGNTKYQPIQSAVQNKVLTLQLPTPIEPNKSGSYFVYFRTNALTQKDFLGAYDYTFKTVKIDDKIQNLQVGISTDAEYILRGAQSEVNYASGVTMAALPADGMERSGVQNAQFDQFYNQIGYGTLNKNASDLAANETYEVKGIYADSPIKLYGKETVTVVIVLLVLLILAIVIVQTTMKRLARKKADKPEDAVVQLKNQNKTFMVAISISFVSMLLVCLYTFGIYAVTQLVSPNMYYGYSNNNMVLTLFVFAVSALVYLFFFFAPAVGMGVKKGLGWALVTFSATVVWAILFLLVLFGLLLFFSPTNNGYPKPFPMMSTMEGRAAPAMDLAQPASTAQFEVAEPAVVDENVKVESGTTNPAVLQPIPSGTMEIKTFEVKTAQ